MRRRNATTEFLKECMADALFILLKKKPLEEITITEITELADVGRVTFYRNFTRKEELITYKMTLLKNQYFKDIPESKETDIQKLSSIFFTYVYETREYLSILYNAGLLESMLFSFSNDLRSKASGNRSKNFKDSFWIFGAAGIIIEWIRNGFEETPDELLQILKSMRLNSANHS